MEPFWSRVNEATLRQGDYFLNCLVPVFDPMFAPRDQTQLMPPGKLKNRAEVQEHYDFLANACGLASSLDWEYYPPGFARLKWPTSLI